MMKIEIGKNYVTLIDDEDYEKIKDIKWRVIKSSISRKPYVYNREHGMMSRLIMDTPAGMECDHISGNTLDNRKSNLRNATKGQNRLNRQKSIGKSSLHKGVSWYSKYNKWRARISFDGKTILLGYFDSEVDAAKSYNEKALELYGEFAVLNEV